MILQYFPSKTVIAIIGITILEAIALFKGLDGPMLLSAIGTIAALGGYALSEAKHGSATN